MIPVKFRAPAARSRARAAGPLQEATREANPRDSAQRRFLVGPRACRARRVHHRHQVSRWEYMGEDGPGRASSRSGRRHRRLGVARACAGGFQRCAQRAAPQWIDLGRAMPAERPSSPAIALMQLVGFIVGFARYLSFHRRGHVRGAEVALNRVGGVTSTRSSARSTCAARPLGVKLPRWISSGLLQGFAVALTPMNLLWCFVGVLLGTVIGVMPGLGPSATIAMLLPLTFKLEPAARSSCWPASTTARSTAARRRRSC